MENSRIQKVITMRMLFLLMVGAVLLCGCYAPTAASPALSSMSQQPIQNREELRQCVMQDQCTNAQARIRMAVLEGRLRPTCFLVVWRDASLSGRRHILKAVRPWAGMTRLQHQSRQLWTNGKDRNADVLWLRQFQSFEVRGKVPDTELAKLRQAIERWDKDDPLDRARMSAIADSVKISEDVALTELAKQRGIPESILEGR